MDERVPQCIELINNERDAMTQAQVSAHHDASPRVRQDGAKHELATHPALHASAHHDATSPQVKMDGAKRQLANAERNTQAEHARLQQENAAHLAKLAAYEMAKALAEEAQQTAEQAKGKGGASAAKAAAEAMELRGESMRMAMELTTTFEALVPYYVYVGLCS